jgi:hypothetical protein
MRHRLSRDTGRAAAAAFAYFKTIPGPLQRDRKGHGSRGYAFPFAANRLGNVPTNTEEIGHKNAQKAQKKTEEEDKNLS